MVEDEDLARRKEREQNEVPKGPRWLWDWKLWVSAAIFAIGLYIASRINGFH